MSIYQNITISLPIKVIEMLSSLIKKGNKSKFIADAVTEKLLEKKLEKEFDIVKETKKIQSQFGASIKQPEVKKLIDKGRKW